MLADDENEMNHSILSVSRRVEMLHFVFMFLFFF